MFLKDYFSDNIGLEFKPPVRWILLFFGGILIASSNYIFDVLAPLQHALQTKDMHLSSLQFNSFYSLFSFANIFASVTVGIMMQKYGDRFICFVVTMFMIFGHIITTFGIIEKSFITASIGRILAGIGSESIAMMGKYFFHKWFKNFETSLAFGFNMAFSRSGVALTALITPILYDKFGIMAALNGATIVGLLGLLSLLIINYFDQRYTLLNEDDFENKELDNFQDKNLHTPVNQSEIRNSSNYSGYGNSYIELRNEEDVNVTIIEILNLGRNFGIYLWMSFSNFANLFAFSSNFNQMFISLYNWTPNQAGVVISTGYTCFIIFILLIGKTVDSIQNKILLLQISIISYVLGLVCFSALGENFYLLGMVLLIIHFGLFQTTYWYLFGRTLTQKTEKISFGISYSIFGLGLCILPLLSGFIRDSINSDDVGYIYSNNFLAIVAFTGFIGSCFIKK